MTIKSKHAHKPYAVLLAGALTLTGCANNPILGLEDGDKGVFFKRMTLSCVAGQETSIELFDVALSHQEVYPGDILVHTVSIDRCVKEGTPNGDRIPVKVTRQIMVGADAVASSTEDVSGQMDRNGIWEVKSQLNIGKNPPGRYAIRTTVESNGQKLVRVSPFTVLR